jgi:hypothetical protein
MKEDKEQGKPQEEEVGFVGLTYSSGESQGESHFEVPLKDLPKEDIDKRVIYLWNKVYRKARGAAVIV